MIRKVIYFHLLNGFCEQADLRISVSEKTKLNVLLNWIKDDFIIREERFIKAFITRDLPTCGIFSQYDFPEVLDFIEAMPNLTKLLSISFGKTQTFIVHLEEENYTIILHSSVNS